MQDLRGKRIWVAGHRGMVGSALVRRLAREDCETLVAPRAELDLTDQVAVRDWLADNKPDAIFLAAAKVGGILANDSYPADFLLNNLLIETAVIAGAHATGVERLVFLGSSCVYPKFASQPIREEALLSGPLEPTNEWYAIAKIAGIKLVAAYRRQHGRDYISAMPTNLYGPGDNYDLASSHVMPALIRKVDTARRTSSDIVVWGSGTPRREFLYVEDCADACVLLMKRYSSELPINVGTGKDISVLELTRMIMNIIGYDGAVVLDSSKPDGTPRKLIDVSRISDLGWRAKTSLKYGIASSYRAFLETEDQSGARA